MRARTRVVVVTVFTPPITRRNHGRGHSYYDANGLKVPGVTRIINDGVPKHLAKWASERTAAHAVDHWDELAELPVSERLKRLEKAANSERDAAAGRGTKVHALAVKLAAGHEVVVPEELRGHVEGYVRFLDDYDVEPVLVEYVVVSYAHSYAGTGDLLADLRATAAVRKAWPEVGGKERARLGLDVKTSKKAVYGEAALQLAAYRYPDAYWDAEDEKEKPVPEVDGCGVVWLPGDGNYYLVPVQAGPAQHRAFLYAAQVAAFCAESRDLIGEPVEPPEMGEL